MRSAPKGGYDFARKRDYRRKVWATLRETLKANGIAVSNAHAALMPSIEGDEIDVALNAGFRESNLHVIDAEPAIVATLKRRFQRINTYGVTVGRAFERMSSRGQRIDCANLDFCGQISGSYVSELSYVSLAGSFGAVRIGDRISVESNQGYRYEITDRHVFSDQAVVAVSCLRGRESTAWTENMQTRSTTDADLDDAEAVAMREADVADLPSERAREKLKDITMKKIRMLRALSERDRQRLFGMQSILDISGLVRDSSGRSQFGVFNRPYCECIRSESYLSQSGQTMLWCVFVVESFAFVEDRRARANEVRARMGFKAQLMEAIYGPARRDAVMLGKR